MTRKVGSRQTRQSLFIFLAITCGSAYAVPICFNPQTQTLPAGVGVTTSGTCDVPATSTRGTVPGFLLDPGTVTNAAQSCTLNFAVPVKNVTVSVGAHSCNSLACEKASFEINGTPHSVLPAELTTPFSYYDDAIQGPAGLVFIDADGNVQGGGESSGMFIGNGTGRVAFSEPAVTAIKVTEITSKITGTIGPAGSWFDICYDGTVSVPPTIQVTKNISGSRINTADQFTVRVLQAGAVSVSATTSAALDTAATSVFSATANTDYVINEVMAAGSVSSLVNYNSSMACTNALSVANGGTDPSTLVQGTAFKLVDGDALSCTITNQPGAPRLTLKKISQGGAANFSFKGSANANGFPTDGSYNITTVNPGETVTGSTVMLAASNVLTEVQEVLPTGWSLTSASCVQAANAGQTNAPTFGIALGDTLQIPANQLQAGSDVQCTLINTFTGLSVSGKVILDNGAGSGTAYDAIQNGAEPAQTGVTLSLSNCASTNYSTTTSGADGSFILSLGGVPAGQAVCIVQTQLPGFAQVSVAVGTTAGSFNSAAGALRFTPAVSTSYSGVVLGNAHLSTLTSDGAQQLSGGQTASYAHIFTAGSAAEVVFTATGADAAWTDTLYLDTNCNGALDAADGAVSSAVTVKAGQQVCLINRVFASAGLTGGTQHTTTIKATETWITPTISPASQIHVLTNTDLTTISAGGLNLIKEVRKLTSCPATAAASMANSTAYSATGSARPGDALEYRLRYSNNTAAPINSVKIYDAIPAFTQFAEAYCLSTPTQGITGCSVMLKPSAGSSSGAIMWALTDTAGGFGGLQPADSGSVGFCISVAQ